MVTEIQVIAATERQALKDATEAFEIFYECEASELHIVCKRGLAETVDLSSVSDVPASSVVGWYCTFVGALKKDA